MGKKNPLKQLEQGVKDILKSSEEAVKGTAESLLGVGEGLWESVEDIPDRVVDMVEQGYEFATKGTADLIKEISDEFGIGMGMADKVWKSMEATGKTALETVKDLGLGAVDAGVGLVEAIPEIGEGILDTVEDVGKLTEDLLIHGGAEDILKDMGYAIEDSVKGIVDTGFEAINDIGEGLINVGKDVFDDVIKPVLDTGILGVLPSEPLRDKGKDVIEDAWEDIKDIFDGEDVEQIELPPVDVNIKQAMSIEDQVKRDRLRLAKATAQSTMPDHTGVGLGEVDIFKQFGKE